MCARSGAAGGPSHALTQVFEISFLRPITTMLPKVSDKPSWVDALEESLLLAIGLFTLITWIVLIGLLAHF